MSYAVAGQMAMSFFTGWSEAYLQKARAEAQGTIDQANANATNLINTTNADAANKNRAANNEFQSIQASLSNTQRSIGNSEKLRGMGTNWDAIETNLTRTMDSMVRGKLSAQLKGAANLGAIRADAAGRGVGGTSAAIMRAAASLSTGASITTATDNQKYVQYDTLLQKQGLLRSSVNSLDFGQALPQLDYGVNVAPLAQAPINAAQFINPVGAGVLSAMGSAAQNWSSIGGSKGTGSKGWDFSNLDTSKSTFGSLNTGAGFKATESYFLGA